MIHSKRKPITSLAILSLLLGSCTMSLAKEYTPSTPNPAYTNAMETIASQLTQIGNPTTGATLLAAPATGGLPPVLDTPTETLPSTSTPLPTKTPLPSNTPTITLTATRTPIPSKTPVPSATGADPKARLGDPDWQDTFQNANFWPIYNDEHVSMQIQGGKLSMTASKADGYEAFMLSSPVLTDFYLEAEIHTGACSGRDRYGLLARAPGFSPIQVYTFGFTCDGYYSLRIWDGTKFVMIVEWKTSEFIKTGPDQTNVLGFMAEGNKITLLANGNLLEEVEDDTFSSGYFGLFIGATNTPGFIVNVTKVSYWEIP